MDALYTCANDDSFAMRALMQFDQAILGKAVWRLPDTRPGREPHWENQALLERHGVLLFTRPWAGIYSDSMHPCSTWQGAARLLFPPRHARRLWRAISEAKRTGAASSWSSRR